MKTHIALLRGINVSGQKIIKMAELRQSLENLGYTSVRTYIQSGNLLFQAGRKTAATLEKEIKDMILKDFGFEVPVVTTSAKELEDAVNHNPYEGRDLSRVFLTLLEKEPQAENIVNLRSVDYGEEEYIIDGKMVFLYSPVPYGKAKLSNNLFEKKLKVKATTRNWKTVNKLIELARS